jgi:hypothetical protein
VYSVDTFWQVKFFIVNDQVINFRSYCIHFVPEISAEHLGKYAALDCFKVYFGEDMVVFADNWFGQQSWMEFNFKQPTTFGMSDDSLGGLWELFSHDLQLNQYRTFFNGKLVVSVFQDKALMKTASTAFQFTKSNPNIITPIQALETNVEPPTLELEESTAKLLSQVCKADLLKIAKALGKPTSKLFSFNFDQIQAVLLKILHTQ